MKLNQEIENFQQIKNPLKICQILTERSKSLFMKSTSKLSGNIRNEQGKLLFENTFSQDGQKYVEKFFLITDLINLIQWNSAITRPWL